MNNQTECVIYTSADLGLAVSSSIEVLAHHIDEVRFRATPTMAKNYRAENDHTYMKRVWGITTSLIAIPSSWSLVLVRGWYVSYKCVYVYCPIGLWLYSCRFEPGQDIRTTHRSGNVSGTEYYGKQLWCNSIPWSDDVYNKHTFGTMICINETACVITHGTLIWLCRIAIIADH